MKIYITGAGVISAIGNNKAENLASLLQMREGVAPIHYQETQHSEWMVGEVKLSNAELQALLGGDVPPQRTTLLGIAALREALVQARLSADDLRDMAFVNGTTVGGMDQSEQHYLDFFQTDAYAELIREHDCGACSKAIADSVGHFGAITCISTACSSAANAVILGARMLKSGAYQRVVVGGTESLSKFHLNGFNTLMILDNAPCRPMDATRAGLNLGEGAAYLVLETEQSAMARGVTPLAELAGYGNACDAFHQTASSADGEGAFRAMQQAVAMGGITPQQVSYVNCHGTGTPNNDPSEIAAMQRLFGSPLTVPFSSTKGFTGHTTSASGSIEAVFCLLSMQQGFIPANLHWGEPMAEGIVPEHRAPAEQPHHQLDYLLCNAFGFGGNDTSLLFHRL